MTFAPPKKIARIVGYGLLILFALITLGCLIKVIPVVSLLGPSMIAKVGVWITILSLVGSVLTILRWRKIRSRGVLIFAGLAVFATVGTTFVQARQVATVQAEGVRVNILRPFWLGAEHHATALPETQPYGQAEGQPLLLDIYRPAAARPGSSAPVLVYVHGGGWAANDRTQRQDDLRWFADQGFVVISVDYTLATKERQTWNTAQPQVGCALAWIAKNAARFGGDASRLALIGESAGGSLVLNVAYMANRGTLQPSCEGDLPHIAAVIAAYPIVDAVDTYRNKDMSLGAVSRLMMVRYTGGTPEQAPDRYAYVSTPTHISASAPPTLVLAAGSDHLVPPGAVDPFIAQARAAGVDARAVHTPYAEHSFDIAVGSFGDQLFRGATVRFLAQNGLGPRP